MGQEAYDTIGQSQLGDDITSSCAKSLPHSHSADLLQAQGGI